MSQRTLPAGFIAPCLPTKTDKLPAGSQWLHEIKHDGFRIIARKNGERMRLYSRSGNDLTSRFPLIVETLARLRSRSCIIDGEAVACDVAARRRWTADLQFRTSSGTPAWPGRRRAACEDFGCWRRKTRKNVSARVCRPFERRDVC